MLAAPGAVDINNNAIEPQKQCAREKNILELNDDCLVHILGYLSLNEWIRLSKVDERFYMIITTYVLRNRDVCLREIREIHSVRSVFQWFVPYAAHLIAASTDVQYKHEDKSRTEELFDLMWEHCNERKLRSLQIGIEQIEIRVGSIERFAMKLHGLKNLEIYSTRRYFYTTVTVIPPENIVLEHILRHAKQLETISISNLPLTAKALGMHTFESLKEISLQFCDRINAHCFGNAMEKIGAQLKRFEWKNSTFFNQISLCGVIVDVCEIISFSAPNLTELVFEMNYGYSYCHVVSSSE